jgi:diketogulonate reductase-like aldo/keto reductase
VPCCAPALSSGTGSKGGFCDDAEYNGTIVQDMQKNNALLEVTTTDLTLLHHPCDTAEHSIQRWLDLEAALAAGLTKV